VKNFEIGSLRNLRESEGKAYLEFLRESSMSMGLYELPAGGTDPQEPHTEDEAYFVVSGNARFMQENEDVEVGPGTVIFVPALKVHRFHSITEDLTVLVFFAPAEYSNRPQ